MATESEVELIVTGQVGLNLQATKRQTGAFVDSFYKGCDADGREIILPAELAFGAHLIGAIISSVNGADVTGFQAVTVCQIISKAERPLTLKFLVNHQNIGDILEIGNLVALPWLLEHLDELSTANVKNDGASSGGSISTMRRNLLNYADCVRVQQNLELLKKYDSGKLVLFEESVALRFYKENSINVEGNVPKILKLLKDAICKNLLPTFMTSIAMKRMGGYLFNCRSCPKLAFSDIIRNKTLLFHFFIFLSRSSRRHILLLCYIHLLENETDVFNNLVLCSTVLDMCKEASLQSLKGRADQIIRMLRRPVLASLPQIMDSQQHTTEKTSKCIPDFHRQAAKLFADVMDCLVWDYTLAIYPSFETSKDCTILHSYILSLDEVSDKNKSILSGEFHSKEGSLNELIRTKKLSSSLTVHRRVKVDTTTSTVPKESPNIFSIMKFDTFVNECNSTKTAKTGKRVSLKIIEGDCSFAQVQLSGDITQIDMTSEKALTSKTRLDDSDGLHALVPFFLPTGKAVVPCKNKNGRIFEVCQPPAKLYSMVLKAKDQTTIYACSLVLYRPVLFLEDSDTTGTCGNDSREAINIDNLLSDKLDDTAGTNAKSLLVEGDTMTSVDNGIEANKESTATSTEYVAKDHLNVLTSTHKAGFSDILTSGFEDMSPSRTNLVCSKRDTSDDSTTFVIPKLTELKFELPTGTQTSPSGAAAGVSELTATTPAVIPLLSSSPRELLSPMERTSPVAFLTAAGIKVKFSTNFSDDESAGLSSSVISHEHVISRSNSAAHIDKKVAIGVMKYPQGAFTEFLSATANATASVASAIVLQAGSLPSSSFAWTESANASKSNEPKGFYDQLPFFRFKSINFTNNSPVHFEIGSQLKRKYEGNAQPEPLTADTEKSLSTELKSLCLTELNLPFSPTSVENSISSQSWNFSSEKPLSSYPRFGAVKSVRRASSSPRSPYRSPSQRNPGHSHNRRFRSQLHGNSRIPYPLNREASDSNSRSEASSTVHSGAAIKKISFDSSSSAQTALLSVSHINSTSITKSVSAERAPPISLSIHSENYTAEREGVAYVAHGFALLTEVPMIGRLRQAASDAASDFANACYPQKSADNGIPYSTLDDHHNFSSMITKCIRSSLKLEENSSLNPNIASSHDSHPDIAAGSNFTFEEKSSDYDSSIVFEALSPKNLVTVLLAFLLEYRIVAVSSEALSASTHLGEWLKDAIYPLKYAHVYSPLVPPCVGLQLIHCPAPFFIGMKRTTKIDEVVESEDEREREKIRGRRGKSAGSKDSSCGLLLVDLDRDECSMPQDLCLLMKSARLLVTALEALLYPKLSCCDQIISQEKESTISVKSYKAMQLCRQFVGSILEGSKRSCLRAVDGDEHIVIFDEILFMQQHFLRLSLHPTTLAMAKVSGKQNITEVEDTIVDAFSTDSMSLLPSSVSGAKDVEKLLRSLIITQCFSLYLTS